MQFWDYLTILGACFLFWLSAILMHKLYVWISHKQGFLHLLMWPVVVVMLLLFAAGLPVTAVMELFRYTAFQKNSKIVARACTIGREYEAYQRFAEANDLKYSDFYCEVQSKYDAFRYHYCLGNDGDGKYRNDFKSYSDYRGRSWVEIDIMRSLNFALEEFEKNKPE